MRGKGQVCQEDPGSREAFGSSARNDTRTMCAVVRRHRCGLGCGRCAPASGRSREAVASVDTAYPTVAVLGLMPGPLPLIRWRSSSRCADPHDEYVVAVSPRRPLQRPRQCDHLDTRTRNQAPVAGHVDLQVSRGLSLAGDHDHRPGWLMAGHQGTQELYWRNLLDLGVRTSRRIRPRSSHRFARSHPQRAAGVFPSLAQPAPGSPRAAVTHRGSHRSKVGWMVASRHRQSSLSDQCSRYARFSCVFCG